MPDCFLYTCLLFYLRVLILLYVLFNTGDSVVNTVLYFFFNLLSGCLIQLQIGALEQLNPEVNNTISSIPNLKLSFELFCHVSSSYYFLGCMKRQLLEFCVGVVKSYPKTIRILKSYLIRHCFKGSVQRKLRWVENGVIRRVWASHRGAGH